jgi:hypothetical protein
MKKPTQSLEPCAAFQPSESELSHIRLVARKSIRMTRVMRSIMKCLRMREANAPDKKATQHKRCHSRCYALRNRERRGSTNRTCSHDNLRVGPRGDFPKESGRYCPNVRQVSWLAGHKNVSAFPVFTSGIVESPHRYTVAGSAVIKTP